MPPEEEQHSFAPLASIPDKLREVETSLASGDPDRIASAVRLLDELESDLDRFPDRSAPGWNDAAASIATARGHCHRSTGRLEEADAAYARAEEHTDKANLDPVRRDRRVANLCTYRGLARLGGGEENWRFAVECFDRSIALREKDPERSDSVLWGLSAAWINRGDALARLGGEDNLEEAIRSNELAAVFLSGFDLNAAPGYRTRLALCHLNAAEARVQRTVRHHRPEQEAALASYERAADILREGADRGIEESCRVLAVVLTNKGRARFALGSVDLEECEIDAREGLSLIGTYRADDREMLTLDLTARVTLCLVLGRVANPAENAGEITDLAEEGLNHARSYLSANGALEPIDAVVGQLFRCGAEAYTRFLPQFLGDYLLDYLDPDREAIVFDRSPACHEAAVETLWFGISSLQREGFGDAGTEQFDRRLELIEQWQGCRARLAEIRSTRFTA